jgi:hypothetical protein
LLLTRGLSEAEQLGKALGAKLLTFNGLAGIGDIIACASTSASRDYELGRRLGAGQKLDDALGGLGGVAESLDTSIAVQHFAHERSLELPISLGVHSALHQQADVLGVIGQLMKLPTGRRVRKPAAARPRQPVTRQATKSARQLRTRLGPHFVAGLLGDRDRWALLQIAALLAEPAQNIRAGEQPDEGAARL